MSEEKRRGRKKKAASCGHPLHGKHECCAYGHGGVVKRGPQHLYFVVGSKVFMRSSFAKKKDDLCSINMVLMNGLSDYAGCKADYVEIIVPTSESAKYTSGKRYFLAEMPE